MASVNCTSTCKAHSGIAVTAYLDVSAGAQSIDGNYTTINYSFSAVRNSYGFLGTSRSNVGTLQVWINGSCVRQAAIGLTYARYGGNTECSGSGSVNVPHNSDGTKLCGYKVVIVEGSDPNGANWCWGGSSSSEPTLTLATIPRASDFTINVGSAKLGSAVSIAIDRKSTNFTHKVYYSFEGSSTVTVSENAATSASFTPAKTLASNIPDATTGTLTIRVDTYSGSTKIGSSVTRSVTLSVSDDAVPTIGSVTATRIDNGVPAAWGVYVKGYSKVRIAINSPAGVYGSTIKSYTINGLCLNSIQQSAASNPLTDVGTATYTCTVTDSRGRTATKTISITVVDYSKPSVSVTADRCTVDADNNVVLDPNGTSLKVTVNWDIASVSSKNTVSSKSATCNGATNYAFASGVPFVLPSNCSIGSSYTLTATITDALGNSATATIPIRTSMRLMNVKANKKGIAFGKFAETDNLFDVNYDAKFRGELSFDGRWAPSLYMDGKGDSSAYMRLCTIKIKSSHVNRPIEIYYSQRGRVTPTRLFILFNSDTSTDPSLAQFNAFDYCYGAYIAKVGTSTWDVFAKKTEPLDGIGFMYWSYQCGGQIELTKRGDHVASLPSGYTEVDRRGIYYYDNSSDAINKQIRRQNPGSPYYAGRDRATLRNLAGNASSMCVLGSMKTPSGSWEMGTLGEDLVFSYVKDADYTNKKNDYKGFKVNNDGVVSGISYSTSEQWTGDYWIDGKKIYQKTITWSELGIGLPSILHGITNMAYAIDYSIIGIYGNSVTHHIPTVYYQNGTGGAFYDTYAYVTNTSIVFANNTSWEGFNKFYATIKYVKTS